VSRGNGAADVTIRGGRAVFNALAVGDTPEGADARPADNASAA
jgi:hypothetical protein